MLITNTKLSGFTLLEVMIALIIFSIGLLGLAGLQAAGIRSNQISYSRTIATQLVYDMADRIRNNPGIDYSSTTPGGDCISAPCSSTAMADFDRLEWNTAINNPDSPLRNSVGFISQSTSGGITFYTVAIGWDEDRAGITATGCSPAAPAGIVCVVIDVFP